MSGRERHAPQEDRAMGKAHTHDPQAVEKIAEAIADTHACMQGGPVPWDEQTPEDQWAYRQLAAASLDAVDALYETEAGE